MLERQETAMPTNKVLVASFCVPVTLPFIGPAVAEVWPKIAPDWLAGPAATEAVTGLVSAIISIALAWLVKDRAGIPEVPRNE